MAGRLTFIRAVETSLPGGPLEAVFIRAPRITEVGQGVTIIATLKGEPVMVRQANLIAATFHPELTEDDRAHRLLVELAEAARQLRGRTPNGRNACL